VELVWAINSGQCKDYGLMRPDGVSPGTWIKTS